MVKLWITYAHGRQLNKSSTQIARFDALIAQSSPAELLAMVVDRVANDETLLQIAQSLDISYSTLGMWLDSDSSRCQAYNVALRLSADRLAHECLEIADGANAESVAVDKLRIDTRMRLASSWDKQRYGKGSAHGDFNLTITVDRDGDSERPALERDD